MTKKVDQMADSFFELAEILEFPFPKMFEDMIRASLLIMVWFAFLLRKLMYTIIVVGKYTKIY